MLKRIGALFVIGAASVLAHGQTAVLPIYACTLPGTQALVSNLKSTNYQMGVIPSCTVKVYLTGTTTIATTTPQSPFVANTNGSIPPIYAPTSGCYDVVLSGGIAPNNYPTPVTLTDVCPGGDIRFIGVVINACSYPGSDLGAKIQAADTAWIGTPVEIDVSQLCGTTESTTFTLSANHNLKFIQGGTYTMVEGNVLSGYNMVSGIGPQVVLEFANNQTGGMFQLSNGSASASHITLFNFTMDGNESNAPSTCSSNTYNCAHGIYVNSTSTTAPSYISVQNIAFQNFYGFPIWIYTGSSGWPEASYMYIQNNSFTNLMREGIRAYSFAGHMTIDGNTFSNYGNEDLTNYDAIYWADVNYAGSCTAMLPALTTDWKITNNKFYNTNSNTKFATEMYGGSLPCAITNGFLYQGNYADAEGGTGGTGLSVGTINASIDHNVFANGTSPSDRTGIEVGGFNTTVSNNTINGGSIYFGGAGRGSPSDCPTAADLVFTGNNVAPYNGTSGVWGMTQENQVCPLNGLTITGGTFDMTNAACSVTTCGGIQFGGVGAANESNVNVTDTTTLGSSGSFYGIRLATMNGYTLTGVNLSNNWVYGAGNGTGIGDTSTDSRDTDIRIINNHLRNVTSPIVYDGTGVVDEYGNSTSATGTGFNSLNGYQAGGLTVINSQGTVLPQVTGVMNPYYYGSNVIATVSFGRWTPNQSEIITQIEYNTDTPPSGCSVAPYVYISDITLGQQVNGTTVNVTGATGSSGSIAIQLIAGHTYAAAMSGGTGCGTNAGYPQLTVQMKNTSSIVTRSSVFVGGSSSVNYGPFIGSGETLTQEDISVQVIPLTCSIYPTVSLYDYTSSGSVSGTTVTLSNSAVLTSSGVIAVTLTSGHEYGWQYTAGSGCGTNAADPMLIAQFIPEFSSGDFAWSSFTHNTASNGNTISFGSFTPQSNLFVSSIAVSLETVPATCSPDAQVKIYDNTASAVVSGTTFNVTAAQTWTSNLAAYLTAGHQYQMQLVNSGTCGTSPAGAGTSVQFNTNSGALQSSNNLSDVQNPSVALANLGGQSALTFPLTPSQGGVGAMTSAPMFLRFYGNGADGAFNLTSGSTTTQGEKWYTSVNISFGATLSDNGGNTPLIIRSTGTCTIAGTISLSPNTGSGAGNATGTTAVGGGTGGGGGGGAAAGTAGSSGNVVSGGTLGGASGGSGGNGNQTGAASYRPILSTGIVSPVYTASVYGGSGGGAGGSSGPTGGKGGGLLILVCPTISFTGTIDASGVAGSASTGNNIGASGGGGGGLVIMSAQTYSANTGTINVAGGTGGGCSSFTGCGTGGNGASGNSIQVTIQ